MDSLPSGPMALLSLVVVVVFGGLVYLLKFLLSEALPSREKQQEELLKNLQRFYQEQAEEERRVCLDNYRALQTEMGRISEVLERLISRLDGK